MPARPTLPRGCRIQGLYKDGVLALRSQPPVEFPVNNVWGPPLTARVAAAQVGPAGTAQVHGWLTAGQVPVLSLRWLPRSWWDDHHSGPALLKSVWQSVVPESHSATLDTPDTHETCVPPQHVQFAGQVVDGELRLQVTGRWNTPGGDGQVTQDLSLTAQGDCTPGAGSLAWAGSLVALGQFVDQQLLPMLGEAPGPPPLAHAALLPPPCAEAAAQVHAHAVWENDEGLRLRAQVRHPDWTLHGSFASSGQASSRIAMQFEGDAAQLRRALLPMPMPRLPACLLSAGTP